MDTLKFTAIALALAVIPGFISGCTRAGVEKQPSGQNYVREMPEEVEKATTHLKEETIERPTGSEKKYEVTKEQKVPGQSYGKEEVKREHKTEHPYKTEYPYTKEVKREHRTETR